MEYSVRLPNFTEFQSDNVPWVLESCRNCIKSAALIIYTHRMRFESASKVELSYYNWCDTQMLFAAYLVILQLKSNPTLTMVLKDFGEINWLLDTVEGMLEGAPYEFMK
jgi:hypothetical protein